MIYSVTVEVDLPTKSTDRAAMIVAEVLNSAGYTVTSVESEYFFEKNKQRKT